jgi:hypothetical protein
VRVARRDPVGAAKPLHRRFRVAEIKLVQAQFTIGRGLARIARDHASRHDERFGEAAACPHEHGARLQQADVVGRQPNGTGNHGFRFVEQPLALVEHIEVQYLEGARGCDTHHGIDIVRVEIECLPEQVDGMGCMFRQPYVVGQSLAAHNQVGAVVGGTAAMRFATDHLEPHAARQTRHDLLLHLEDVLAFLVETLRPQGFVRLGVDQLGIDADVTRFGEHPAFEHVAHAKLLADLARRHFSALVGEGSRSGNDETARQGTRQTGDQIVDDTVDEVVVGGILRQVQEGQYDDGKPARQRCRGFLGDGDGFGWRRGGWLDCGRRQFLFLSPKPVAEPFEAAGQVAAIGPEGQSEAIRHRLLLERGLEVGEFDGPPDLFVARAGEERRDGFRKERPQFGGACIVESGQQMGIQQPIAGQQVRSVELAQSAPQAGDEFIVRQPRSPRRGHIPNHGHNVGWTGERQRFPIA